MAGQPGVRILVSHWTWPARHAHPGVGNTGLLRPGPCESASGVRSGWDRGLWSSHGSATTTGVSSQVLSPAVQNGVPAEWSSSRSVQPCQKSLTRQGACACIWNLSVYIHTQEMACACFHITSAATSVLLSLAWHDQTGRSATVSSMLAMPGRVPLFIGDVLAAHRAANPPGALSTPATHAVPALFLSLANPDHFSSGNTRLKLAHTSAHRNLSGDIPGNHLLLDGVCGGIANELEGWRCAVSALSEARRVCVDSPPGCVS